MYELPAPSLDELNALIGMSPADPQLQSRMDECILDHTQLPVDLAAEWDLLHADDHVGRVMPICDGDETSDLDNE